MRKGALIIYFIVLTTSLCGQPSNRVSIFENFKIAVSAGVPMVITEYKRDLSGVINEMHHRPGFGFTAGVSKEILHNWELGFEYEYSYLHGFQNNPNFSAYRYGHYQISQMRLEPVIYRTKLINQNFTFTYHITGTKYKRLNPFLFFKGGFSKLLSEVRYKSNKELIFEKTGWDPNNPKASVFVTTINLGAGVGAEIVLDTHFSLNIKADCATVNDDNIDGVQNFKEPPPAGYINYVSGLYGRFMVGVSYMINPGRQTIASRKYRLKDSFQRKKKKHELFPWFKK